MSKSFKVDAAEIIRDSTHNYTITEVNELDNEIYFNRIRYLALLQIAKQEHKLENIALYSRLVL
jgi:hypothetical protein